MGSEMCIRDRYKDGHYELHDLGSTNGTYVDGVRVTRTVLRNGAVINVPAVSYTHLTLPTKRIVEISGGDGALKKKKTHKYTQ